MLPRLSGFLEQATVVVMVKHPQRGACILGSIALGCCVLVVVVVMATLGYFYYQSRRLHPNPISASQAQGRLAILFPGFHAPAGYEVQAGTTGTVEGILWHHQSEPGAVVLLIYASPSRDLAFDPQRNVEEFFLRGQAGFPGDAKVLDPLQVKLGKSQRCLEQVEYPAGKALRVQGCTPTHQFQWIFLGMSGQQTQRFTVSLPWNELTLSEAASAEQLQLMAQVVPTTPAKAADLALNPEDRFSADGICLGTSLDQVRRLRNIPEASKPLPLMTSSRAGVSLFGYSLEHETSLFIFDPGYKLEAIIGAKSVFLGKQPYLTLGERANTLPWVSDRPGEGYLDRKGERLCIVRENCGVLRVKGLTLIRHPCRGLNEGCKPAPTAAEITGERLTQLPWE